MRVSVSYLPEQSEPARGRWFWAYHIRIENDGDQAVQLLTRHWIITDGRGARHSVEGEGVVGEQPVIAARRQLRLCLGLPAGDADRVDAGQLSHDRRGRRRRSTSTIPKFALIAPAVASG